MNIINEQELAKLIKKQKLKNYEEEISKELLAVLNKTLEDKIKEIKNKERIIANDNAKAHAPAKSIFSDSKIASFPSPSSFFKLIASLPFFVFNWSLTELSFLKCSFK